MYSSYVARVKSNGNTMKESLINSTKRQISNKILNSPSMQKVTINNNIESIPCIPSNISKSFKNKSFLFNPDEKIKLGDYVHLESLIYLIDEKKTNSENVYPIYYSKLCNENFLIGTVEELIDSGKKDNLGKPIYNKIITKITRPCVWTTKIYSNANNSEIPLPDGAVIVYLPYSDDSKYIPKINNSITVRNEQYKITTISYENVVTIDGITEGIIEVQLQRIPLT